MPSSEEFFCWLLLLLFHGPRRQGAAMARLLIREGAWGEKRQLQGNQGRYGPNPGLFGEKRTFGGASGKFTV
jgi:hypothetical protein